MSTKSNNNKHVSNNSKSETTTTNSSNHLDVSVVSNTSPENDVSECNVSHSTTNVLPQSNTSSRDERDSAQKDPREKIRKFLPAAQSSPGPLWNTEETPKKLACNYRSPNNSKTLDSCIRDEEDEFALGSQSILASPALDDEGNFLPSYLDAPPSASQADHIINYNWLNCAFFSPPSDVRIAQDPTSGTRQIVITLGDIQPHLVPTASSKSDSTSSDDHKTPPTIYQGMSSSSMNSSRGKTLETIAHLSQSKPKKIRKTSRSLPVRVREESTRKRAKKQDDYESYSPSSTSSYESDGMKPCKKLDFTGGSRAIEHFTPSEDVTRAVGAYCHQISSEPYIQGCKCTRSKCLKLYCDCFQAGQVCTGRCVCKSCQNTIGNSGQGGLRSNAIENILLRRPGAFDMKPKKTGEGCSCKKNKCLKKYCDCFNIGTRCDSRCRCNDCKNGKNGQSEDDESECPMNELETTTQDQEDEVDFNASDDETMMLIMATPQKHDVFMPYLSGYVNSDILNADDSEFPPLEPDFSAMDVETCSV